MTAILRQMEDYHYAHLIKTFGKMRTDVVVSFMSIVTGPVVEVEGDICIFICNRILHGTSLVAIRSHFSLYVEVSD